MMVKPVCGLAALVLSVCTGYAMAQAPAQLATALDAAASAQYYDQGRGDWRPGPGWDRDIDVNCSSSGYNYQMCQVDTGMGSRVVLRRQTSNTRCIEGRNWGWNRAGIWVDQGCAGVFRVQRRWNAGPGPGPGPGPGGPGWQPGPGWDRDITINCGSPQYNYAMCQVDTGRGSRVYIQRQLSDTRCVEGQNWGWNRAGIWVDKGCSAVFVVQRRWN